MSKDLAIAGVMVVSCLVVSAIAFIPPKDAGKPTSAKAASGYLAAKPTPARVTPAAPIAPVQPPHVEPIPITAPNASFDPGHSAFDPGRTAFDAQPKPTGTAFAPTPAVAPTPAAPRTNALDPAPVVGKTDEPKTHVVQSGEMLGDISLKYYGTSKKWRAIQEANPGLDPERLLVGQKIAIPALKDAPKPVDGGAKPATAPEVGAGECTYTVKEGDRYYTIAQRELGDASRYKELETLNKTPGEELKVGQVIKLPAKKDAAAPAVGDKPAKLAGGAPAIDDGKKRHTVGAGDTLGDISTKYFGTSKRWHDIVAANPGIDPEKLVVGQKLVIPDAPADAGKPAKGDATSPAKGDAALDKPLKLEPSKPADGGGDTVEYVVKSGDGSLYAIAEHLYKRKPTTAEVERIQKANAGLDAHSLRVGQKIKVPGVKSDAPAKPADKPAPPANPFAPGANPFAPDAKTTGAQPLKPATPVTAPGNPFTTPANPAFAPRPATPPATSVPVLPPAAPVPPPKPATPPAAAKPFDTLGSPSSPSPAPAANPAAKPDAAKTADDPFKDFFARP